ncbi:hypothetical protein [Rathayibacter sp. VKM Ac-2630]|uniref:hypothetical protein n=1 Tax=Rathayibacter sp. VKM Ac-2630 TaxID=1938617 RepID=UPI0009815CA8|nr:hypothetical protein [Rathayibacter sp. VKM Ac-2630]OOB90311.1 hypothetical protein B0T42_12485 [Rathayibacter sp. VKM Ac-2630]
MTKQQELETALAAEAADEGAPACIRGCVRRGTEHDDVPELLGARHGRFCDRCFFGTQSTLRLMPVLAGHIAALVGVKGGDVDSEVRGGKEAPLPFNAQAFDDLNGLYESVVQFAGLFAARLRVQRPEAALRAWRTSTGRVKGLPGDASSWLARREVAVMTAWLDQHLERVFVSARNDEYVDVISYFVDEVRDFRRLAARWPLEMRAAYSRLPHSDGVTCCWPRRIAIIPAPGEGESRHIRCDGCGHLWTEDEYAAAVLAYEAELRALARPSRVKRHLVSKYTEETGTV